MIFLLVFLTFAIGIIVSLIIERRRETAKQANIASVAVNPVFAQDGGEPVEKTTEEKDKE